MVYAMFSIGILGFLVWSLFVVAPSYCEVRFNNFAVCWESSTLLGTFYSENLRSETQSAGNPKLYSTSSSETIREASSQYKFLPFREFYKVLGFTNNISNTWLLWFVGFVEGDGALMTYKGRPRFVLTQKEESILEHIKNVLGFGTVRKFSFGGTVFYRYIVDEIKGIMLLALIFNGNLVLPRRSEQLRKWFHDINYKLQNPVSNIFKICSKFIFIDELYLPNLNDAWISGFTDAEGTFNVNISKRNETFTGYRVQLRFCLDQKFAFDQLNNICDLFGYGKVILRKQDTYRYYCDSFVGLGPICNYFTNFPLKTKKSNSLTNWLKVYNMVLKKEHLSEEGLQEVRNIKRSINLNNAENTKIGSAKP
jgi:hypothetical protein